MKLIDFGEAGLSRTSSDAHRKATLSSVAPEVLNGAIEDQRADIYSLGVSICNSFGLEPVTEATPRPRLLSGSTLSIPDQLDLQFKNILIRMIQPTPDARPSTGGEIVASLAQTSDDSEGIETTDGVRAYFSNILLPSRVAIVELAQSAIDEVPAAACAQTLECPRVFLLGGETGIGKSTLLNAVQAHAQVSGLRTLSIRCNPNGRDPLPLLYGAPVPVNEGIDSNNYTEVTTKSINPQGSLLHDVPALSTFGIRSLHELATHLRDSSLQMRTAIFIEDLHLADLETLELIRLLSIHDRGPLMFASYSTDAPPRCDLGPLLRFLRSRANSRLIALERLGRDEIQDFLAKCLGSADEIKTLSHSLSQLTGGNVLLMVEALTGFATNGQIIKRPGGWIIKDMVAGSPDLPQNLRAFAGSRLGSLDLRLRRLLEIIAVFDNPVTLFHLKELSQRSISSLLSDLQVLVIKGFLHRIVNDTADHYEFHHRCVREVIYEEMELTRRRTLHLRAGELLENSSSPIPDSLLERAAYHFIEGMDRDKGPDYAFKAAAISYENFSLHRAIDLLVQGLNLLPRHNTAKRFEGLEAVTRFLGFAGDLQRASKFYFEMLLVAKTIGALDKEALAIREMGRVLIEGGDIIRGLSYAEEAERRFSDLADSAGLAGAVILQAQAHLKTGNLALADERAERAYGDSVKVADIQGQSLARSVGGLIAFELGEPGRALTFYEEAFQLAVRINDISASTVILNNIGLAYLEQNLIKRAQPYFTKALTEARLKGLSLPATLASINLGEVNRLEGSLSVAEELFQEALALADGANRKYLLAYATYSLGLCLQLRGSFAQALDQFAVSQIMNTEAGSRREASLALVAKADLLHDLGRRVEAIRDVETAVELAKESGNQQALILSQAVADILSLGKQCIDSRAEFSRVRVSEARKNGKTQAFAKTLELFALLSLSADRPADALDDIQEMKTIAKEAGLRPDIARAALLEGQALMKLQRSHEARLVLQQGADAAREMGLRPLLSHLLYWLSQAQEAGGDAQAAADSVFEAADVIRAIAADIKDEEWRQSYLNVPINLAALQHAERVERAGMRRRPSADESTADPEAAASRAFEEVRRQLGAEAPLRTLLTAVLDKAVEAIRADRGLLILLDPARAEAGAKATTGPNTAAEAEVTIARNLEGETIRDAADYCRSILHEVAAGEAILAVDVPADARFRARQSVTLYNILSLMCVPLKLGERVLGAIYFDSRSGDRLFRQNDLRLIEAFSVKVSAAIAEAQESQRLRERAVVINRELARKYHMNNLIGESSAMQRLFRMMEAVIRADCNVLVVGESGTGKELVARAIHYAGARKLCNFVPLDCGAVPENLIESELFGHRRGAFTGADSDKKGLFEEADGGSLFLDEITNTSPAFQAKLLRALQSGEFRRVGETLTRRVDARIIAATNADIDQAIKNGRFREDLYYRLNVVTLTLPTLRERRDDIPLLAEHFARQLCQSRGIPYRGIGRGAMARLQAHSWPGNVRELEHAVDAALVVSGDGMVRREALPEKILGGELEVVRDLLCEAAAAAAACPDGLRSADGHESLVGRESEDDRDSDARTPTPMETMEPEERVRVEEALIKSGGDKSRAARLLGWNRMRLYRRLKILGIPYDTGKQAD